MKLDQFPALRWKFFNRKEPADNANDIRKILNADRVAWIEQVHGNRSIVVDAALAGTEKADGLATDTKNLALVIQVADCQALLFYDPIKHVVSLLHAGWRGLASNAVAQHIALLTKTWNVQPENLFIFIAPSICATCYEFKGGTAILPTTMHDYWHDDHLDLMRAADDQLVESGILHDRIDRSRDCTSCKRDMYWSWRAGNTGPKAPREHQTKRNFLAAMLV
jgi:YfiH family protein